MIIAVFDVRVAVNIVYYYKLQFFCIYLTHWFAIYSPMHKR